MAHKRWVCLVLSIIWVLGASGALAEAATEPLGTAEMLAWRDGVWATLAAAQVINDPSATNDPDGSGIWLFEYEAAIMELTEPSLEGGAESVVEIELMTGAIACPRGIVVGDSLERVLSAYPNENPELAGDPGAAVLYADATDGWGWLIRRGQEVDSVAYTVIEASEDLDGHYRELTLLYLIEEGQVSAIRGSGFSSLVSQDELALTRIAIEEMAGAKAYTPSGAQTEEGQSNLAVEDLTFGGILFKDATPERMAAQLGTPTSDTVNDAAGVRTITYEGLLMEFLPADGAWQLAALLVSETELEGPKGLRPGDTLEEVRGLLGQGTLDGQLFYRCTGADGQEYVLACTFQDNTLIEYLVYRT